MDTAARTLGTRIRDRLGRIGHDLRLRAALRHVAGPSHFDLGADDVVVVTLVRNGVYYLDAFLDHHRSIGARGFVFIDNASDDGTPDRLATERDCAVLSAKLPWGAYENALRGAAARRYCTGHWCLYADMDEMFDLPPGFAALSDLTADLRAKGQTALVAQMLEMFPDAPLRDLRGLPYGPVIDRFDHCDLGHVSRFAYHDPSVDFAWYLAQNRLSDPDTPVMFGGLRRRVFGEDCCLTKHPLVFLDGRTQPGVHPHCAARVTCAGFTGLIRHYKFANDPFARDRATAARRAIPHGEDRQRLAVADVRPDLSLMGDGAQPFTGQMDLFRKGFLCGIDHLVSAGSEP